MKIQSKNNEVEIRAKNAVYIKQARSAQARLEERIIMILGERGATCRDEIVRILQKPRTTIYDRLKSLIEKGVVRVSPEYRPDRKRGRPRAMFSLRECPYCSNCDDDPETIEEIKEEREK